MPRDVGQGKRERDEALRQVDEAARAAFIADATNSIIRVATERESFSVDDCWEYVTETTSELRAMGAAMIKVKAMGLISKRYMDAVSLRPTCHRCPRNHWWSKIYGHNPNEYAVPVPSKPAMPEPAQGVLL